MSTASKVKRYSPDNLLGLVGNRWQDQWGAIDAEQRYLMQMAFVDRLIGKLLDQLEATEGFHDSILVVTADHGVSFRLDQPRRRLSQGNVADILPIPLFIRFPGQSGGKTSNRNVETVDILPTILELLGASPLPEMDGISALSTLPARAREPISLAIVVRDRIEGSTKTIQVAGRPEQLFAFNLPPSMAVESPRDLQFLRVEGLSTSVQLRPLSYRASLSFELLVDEDGRATAIQDENGQRYVITDAIRGWADSGKANHQGLSISGWAYDESAGAPADWVIVFAQGNHIGSTSPSRPRAGVARRFGENARRSGFELSISAPELANSGLIRVFALAEQGYARELRYGKRYELLIPNGAK